MNTRGSENNTRHKTIAAELSSHLRPLIAGSKIPTIRMLMKRFSASQSTIEHSLQNLETTGLIRKIPGRGYFRNGEMNASPRTYKEIRKDGILYFAVPLIQGHLLYNTILSGVEPKAREYGLETVLLNLSLNKPCEKDIEQLRRKPADIVFAPVISETGYEVNSAYLDLFEKYKINYVVVDTPVSYNSIIRGNFVGADGYSIMREAVRFLTRAGHKNIGSIRLWPGVYSSDQRFNGIIDELRVQGMPIRNDDHCYTHNVELRLQGRLQIRNIMANPTPPTAIICSHDMLALNVMEELRTMGKKVPEDISIFGFGNDDFSETAGIATASQPLSDIGRRAVELLMDFNQNILMPQRHEFLPCKLIPRTSVAAPNQSSEYFSAPEPLEASNKS